MDYPDYLNRLFWVGFRNTCGYVLVFCWMVFSINVIARMNTHPWTRILFAGLLLWALGLVLTYVWDAIRFWVRRKISS